MNQILLGKSPYMPLSRLRISVRKNSFFENFMYWGLKGGILNIADYDPLGYELSCCSSILLGFLNFVQSYFGHTVCKFWICRLFCHEKIANISKFDNTREENIFWYDKHTLREAKVGWKCLFVTFSLLLCSNQILFFIAIFILGNFWKK